MYNKIEDSSKPGLRLSFNNPVVDALVNTALGIVVTVVVDESIKRVTASLTEKYRQ